MNFNTRSTDIGKAKPVVLNASTFTKLSATKLDLGMGVKISVPSGGGDCHVKNVPDNATEFYIIPAGTTEFFPLRNLADLDALSSSGALTIRIYFI